MTQKLSGLSLSVCIVLLLTCSVYADECKRVETHACLQQKVKYVVLIFDEEQLETMATISQITLRFHADHQRPCIWYPSCIERYDGTHNIVADIRFNDINVTVSEICNRVVSEAYNHLKPTNCVVVFRNEQEYAQVMKVSEFGLSSAEVSVLKVEIM